VTLGAGLVKEAAKFDLLLTTDRFACGFPAFGAVTAIIWLMIAKPDF
jgi:uncharacterized membrane protein